MYKPDKFYVFGLILFFLNAWQFSKAQNYELEIILQYSENGSPQISTEKYILPDSLTVLSIIHQKQQELQKQGYWQAKLDSLEWINYRCMSYFQLNALVKWKELSTQNVDKVLLQEIKFKESHFQNKPFSYLELEELYQAILVYSENNGYPFAQVKLDSFQEDSSLISASLLYETGPLVTFDTLYILGNLTIKPSFLANYLRLGKDELFNQANVKNISERLARLPYLEEKRNSELLFSNKKAYVSLFLEKRKANQFDGILGVQPNEERPNEVLLTGEVNLKLYNLFKSGKTFLAKWQRLTSVSQLLDLEYRHPSLFGSNLEAGLKFYLLREDSTFLSTYQEVQLSFPLSLREQLQLFVNFKSSSTGSRFQFSSLDSLPNISDLSITSYGIRYSYQKLDDFFYPRKGAKLNFEGTIGRKRIAANPLLADSLYNGLVLNSSQISLKGEGGLYQPIFRRSTFYSRLQFAWLNNQSLFLNDLYRIGGLNSLRGFNENNFFASLYTILNLEYRLWVDKESYLFLLFDQGFYERRTFQEFQQDFPFGVGLGLSLRTKAGILSVVYALGNEQDNPIAFQNAKIHFGIISRF